MRLTPAYLLSKHVVTSTVTHYWPDILMFSNFVEFHFIENKIDKTKLCVDTREQIFRRITAENEACDHIQDLTLASLDSAVPHVYSPTYVIHGFQWSQNLHFKTNGTNRNTFPRVLVLIVTKTKFFSEWQKECRNMIVQRRWLCMLHYLLYKVLVQPEPVSYKYRTYDPKYCIWDLKMKRLDCNYSIANY